MSKPSTTDEPAPVNSQPLPEVRTAGELDAPIGECHVQLSNDLQMLREALRIGLK